MAGEILLPLTSFKTGEMAPQGLHGYKLSEFLSKVIPGVVAQKLDFNRVNEVLNDQIHKVIPGDLTDELGLPNLKWLMLAHPQALDVVMVGHDQEPSDESANIHNGIAVVSINRLAGPINNRAIMVWDVGISGVMETSAGRRIVAAAYTPEGPIDRLDVSATDAELAGAKGNTPRAVFIGIPPSADNLGTIAGAITTAMIRDVNLDKRGGGIQSRIVRAGEGYRGMSLVRILDGGLVTRPLGFCLDVSGGQYIFSYNPGEENPLPSWQVLVPNRLAAVS